MIGKTLIPSCGHSLPSFRYACCFPHSYHTLTLDSGTKHRFLHTLSLTHFIFDFDSHSHIIAWKGVSVSFMTDTVSPEHIKRCIRMIRLMQTVVIKQQGVWRMLRHSMCHNVTESHALEMQIMSFGGRRERERESRMALCLTSGHVLGTRRGKREYMC